MDRQPKFEICGLETADTFEEYVVWLRSPYIPDGPRRWANDRQMRYNYFVLVIALARNYGWI